MTLAATARLEGPVLEETLERTPWMNLAVEGRTRTPDGRLDLTAWIAGADLSDVETSLDADTTVSRWVPIGRDEERGLYRVRLTESATALVDYERWTDGRAVITEERWTGDAWVIEGRFRDRSVLQRFAARCEASDVDFSLLRVFELDELPGERRFGLTDLQARSLRLALEEGLYAVPRRTNLEELAGALDVSHQALSERLRRGVGTLLENTLGEGTTTDDRPTRGRGVPREAAEGTVTLDQLIAADS